MSRIGTIFLVSIYGLSAVAGLMLAFAEGDPFPAILTPPVALIAYVFTERMKSMHLPVLVANLLGVIALVAVGIQMNGVSTEARLLAGAHFVVYVSWIVLFQAKGLRQYWWMCALAVLQVAVGSILTVASIYGGMLIAFMFAAIWTLSLFSLYQARLKFDAEGWPGESADGRSDRRDETSHRSERRAPSLLPRRSAAQGSIQFDPDERWLGARFALSILSIGAAALVVAAGFFLFIPRLWAGHAEWGSEDLRRFQVVAMSGFSNVVKLGDFVPFLENPKRVLQVRLVLPNGLPLEPMSYAQKAGFAEPLFRGAALDTYLNGTWSGVGREQPLQAFPSTTMRRNFIREQILMEPIGTPLLFATHPLWLVRIPGAESSPEIQPTTLQLFRPESIAPDKPLTYEVYLPPPAEAATNQFIFIPMRGRGQRDMLRRCRVVPQEVPRLAALARQVTGYSPDKPSDPDGERRLAETLVAHLRDSGTYGYSLDTSLQDATIDPVEDFLLNRKSGHCEYFASALALMLRAVDIPARVVTGFKGGTTNAISGVFEVEQRHAHAWVEAFISQGDRFGRGSWVVYDATPPARDASVESFESKMRSAHELASVMTSTWSRFVVNMDISQQQTAFYTPILAALREWWTPTDGSRPLIAQLIEGIVEFVTDPTQWFTLKGLTGATAVGGGIALLVFLVRMRGRLWRMLRRSWSPRPARRHIRIAFYERFEGLCAQMGLLRASGQTQREFAGTVGPRIRQLSMSSNGLAEFPPQLAEFFYRARFAEEDLPPAVIEGLNRDLSALEQAVRTPQRPAGAPAGH